MKITLELGPSASACEAFAPGEYVKGMVHIHLERQDTVSNIILSLQGVLEAVISPSSVSKDTAPVATDSHKIFQVSQDIFRPALVSSDRKAFTLTRGTSSFPFQIQLPKFASCPGAHSVVPHLKRFVPPSFTCYAPGHRGFARAYYSLRVQVKRPGAFKTNPSYEHRLLLMLLDPTPPLWMLDAAHSNFTQLLPIDNSDSDLVPSAYRSASCIRLRTDSFVAVETTLPSPPILYIGGQIPLRIYIKRAGGAVDDCAVLVLRSLTIAILTWTTITLRPDRISWTSNKDLVALSGLGQQFRVSSADSKFASEVSNDLWTTTTISDVTPSFTTCTAMRKHSLIVEVGFSYNFEDEVHVVQSAMDVDLHSGIATGKMPMEEDGRGRPSSPVGSSALPPPYH